MPRQHSRHVMRKMWWRSICYNPGESRTNCPSNLNYNGTTPVKWSPDCDFDWLQQFGCWEIYNPRRWRVCKAESNLCSTYSFRVLSLGRPYISIGILVSNWLTHTNLTLSMYCLSCRTIRQTPKPLLLFTSLLLWVALHFVYQLVKQTTMAKAPHYWPLVREILQRNFH